MAAGELQSPLLPPPPRRVISAAAVAWWAALTVAATLALLLLVAGFGPLPGTSCGTGSHRPRSSPPDPVELTLLTAAHDKGAVCLDGSSPGYHLQTGSGAGSRSWLIHLEGGAWCDTVRSCSGRAMTHLGSSKFMEKQINFTGILSNDPVQNPEPESEEVDYIELAPEASAEFEEVVVVDQEPEAATEEVPSENQQVDGSSCLEDTRRNAGFSSFQYYDGASFSGDSQHEDGNGTLFFRGRRIWEAVLDDLMEKGLAHSKQALLTGCSAGGLATLLHCNDFRARFPQEVSVKCLPDAGFFVDAKDLSGQRSMRSVYNGVVHLQNVAQVLPKDCLLTNKDPTECFFPAELIKNITTPTFIVNSAYDSWQVHNVVAPDKSSPDESWRRCRADIRSCNSSQIKVLKEFRKEMVDGLKAAEDNFNNSWFIDSCFTHCQAWSDNSQWNPPVVPRLGNKTLVQAVGDWYFGRSESQVVREIGCEYPCNPTCN